MKARLTRLLVDGSAGARPQRIGGLYNGFPARAHLSLAPLFVFSSLVLLTFLISDFLISAEESAFNIVAIDEQMFVLKRASAEV